MEFGFEPVCDQLRTSFEPAIVMEFGSYKRLCLYLPDLWQVKSSSTEARLDGRKIEDVLDSFAPLFSLLVLCECDIVSLCADCIDDMLRLQRK